MKRIGYARLAVGLMVIIMGLMAFLARTGVREISPPAQMAPSPSAAVVPAADDWPWWRGQGVRNSKPAASPPLNWSISENVDWKVHVPGRGHSSPCVWGNQIFLSTSDDEKQTISLMSFDKTTGTPLWTTVVQQAGFAEIHRKNSHASSTPACDGRSVFVPRIQNGSLWVSSVDLSGNLLWQCEAGPYSSEWGYGSSPAIFDSLVIVSADNRGHTIDRVMGTSWAAGIDRQTGQIVWRIKRPEGDSFGTAVVGQIAGRDQMILAGKDSVTSYNPRNGQNLWTCRWNMKRTANTLTFDDQMVYATGRQPSAETVCIRADGDGDVTETHLVWREKKVACDVPSPIAHRDHLYVLTDEGVLNCLNSSNGKSDWKRRLGGNFSASPLIAGNHLFCSNEDGLTFVIDLNGRSEPIAENSLSEGIMASPIISGHRMIIRTSTALYSLSSARVAPLADATEDSRKR